MKPPGPLQIRIQRTTQRPASEPYVPTALARVFDPDGNLAAWADFTDQQEGTAAQLLTVPPSKSGIYRISFSGGRTGDLIEIGLPQTEIWGIRGEMALGLTGTLPETLYLMDRADHPCGCRGRAQEYAAHRLSHPGNLQGSGGRAV